jgi:predicted dehydrogenase
MSARKKYAIVGLGGRHKDFRNPLIEKLKDRCELVALCDNNAGRIALARRQVSEMAGIDVAGYAADDFDRMIREARPDTVVVTTRDCQHDDYICRAMEAGCDVITEKPMTTDEVKCRRILDTQRKTGRVCTVAFNYRYSPVRTQMKDLLMSGIVGEVLSLDFHWLLDTRHGADYFRRWHRNKANSGGLLVHKSTHHFDLINWWLSAVPVSVYAKGARKFYRPATAERYGLAQRGERCLDCPEGARCRFRLDMSANDNLKELYLDCEQHDGYLRDRCVFSPDIDIEDTMSVMVDYSSGATMTYSLNAFSPWEGYLVGINGSRGRLEHTCQETVYINADGSVPGALKKEGTTIKVFPHWKPAYQIDVWQGEGGHGGADPVIHGYLFDPANQPVDRYLRAADQRAGSYSILTGIAANRSMERGAPVRIDDLVPDIGMPDYPPMPSADEPLAMPVENKTEGA